MLIVGYSRSRSLRNMQRRPCRTLPDTTTRNKSKAGQRSAQQPPAWYLHTPTVCGKLNMFFGGIISHCLSFGDTCILFAQCESGSACYGLAGASGSSRAISQSTAPTDRRCSSLAGRPARSTPLAICSRPGSIGPRTTGASRLMDFDKDVSLKVATYKACY